MKAEFSVLNHIPKDKIVLKVNEMGKRKLTETGHGYQTYKDSLISLAAHSSAKNYTKKTKKSPAIALIEVVLSANRNYNKVVEPNINCIRKNYPELVTFNDLQKFIKETSQTSFYKFWGHKNKEKYNTLKNILKAISKLRLQYPQHASNDFKLMRTWAKDACVDKLKDDIIGSIRNIGIATFQHLRMTFGFDTVKPDLRVKQVLEKEFNIKSLSNINAIKAVEQIASIVNLSVIECDQVFVMYGSSYYNTTQSKNKSSKSKYECI
jgi:hypothetical protein